MSARFLLNTTERTFCCAFRAWNRPFLTLGHIPIRLIGTWPWVYALAVSMDRAKFRLMLARQ